MSHSYGSSGEAVGEHLLFRWRDAVRSESGPGSSTRRFVLLLLSLHAKVDGSDCYPSTRRLAAESRLSRRSVEEHLRLAEEEGWIGRRKKGQGQDWASMIYTFTLPAAAAEPKESAPQPTPPEATEPDGFPTLDELPRNGSARVYPPEFEGAFAALPDRHVSHPKAQAYKAWRARTSEVDELFQLEAAAWSYREQCEMDGNAGSKFVMQAARFFGPGEEWKPYCGLDVAPGTPPSGNGAGAYVSRSALGGA